MSITTLQRFFYVFCVLMLFSLPVQAQINTHDLSQFTLADTLRGMLNPQRACYDVNYYNLSVEVFPESKSIQGNVDIRYKVVQPFTSMQVDLFANMIVDSIAMDGKTLKFERIANAIIVHLPEEQTLHSFQTINIAYHGQPTIAKRAPWDGGFVWTKDRQGTDWVAVACEGDGASLWWPNKDHLSDEPDSMHISITTPEHLFAVANGNLIATTPLDGQRKSYHWKVSYPINNYNVTLNVGDYVHFSDTYTAKDGDTMPMDYYVLSYELDRAKEHFQQAHEVLACYEKYFGKYPFWDDGYALVETPYLGMEHQGAIAYGNYYSRGYMGGMIPEDMDWDYIIVHETGHEYFGNSVSCNDHAEMWIHESFTTYLEVLFVEYKYSYKDAIRYVNHFNNPRYVRNQKPMVGPLNVNFTQFGSSDHYFKGSLFLNTLRHVINNDEKWFDLLRSLYETYTRKHANTKEIINFFNDRTDLDLRPIFQQYLYHANIPILEYRIRKKKKNKLLIEHRWKTDVDHFQMPISIQNDKGEEMRTMVTNKWQKTKFNNFNTKNFWINTQGFLIDVDKQ